MMRDGKQVTHGGYTTDLITDFSIEWLKQRDKSKQPFLAEWKQRWEYQSFLKRAPSPPQPGVETRKHNQ